MGKGSMFQRLPETQGATVRVAIDGQPYEARDGDTVAAAMFAAGFDHAARRRCRCAALPYCMMWCVLRLPGTIEESATGRVAWCVFVMAADHDATRQRELGSEARFARRVRLCCRARTGWACRGHVVCARRAFDRALREQASPCGQIYRSITDTPVTNESLLGPDYWKGGRLAAAFAKSGAEYVAGATVWSLTPEREIGVSVRGGSRLLTARRVILATGALERPFPIPGWTLPGVMTAGAGQVLLKSSGLIPQGPTFLRDAAVAMAAGCAVLAQRRKLDALLTPVWQPRRDVLTLLVPVLAVFFKRALLLRSVKRRCE